MRPGPVPPLERRDPGRAHAGEGAQLELPEQGVLVGEVVVEGADSDLGPFCDRVRIDALHAALGEEGEPGGEQSVPGVLELGSGHGLGLLDGSISSGVQTGEWS